MSNIIQPARFLTTAVMLLVLVASAFADTLRLKDGSIIKGRIVAFGGGKFTVVVGEGGRQRQLTFDASEVESIQFDSNEVKSQVASSRPTQPAVNPRIVETSTLPKTSPRVITTDSTPSSTAKSAPVRDVPQPKVMESANTAGSKPVEVSVKVLADSTSNGWTNSGWVVKKGQKIRIIGDGQISIGGGKSTGPSGLYDVEDDNKLLKSVPTGALIAVIGDDNNEFIYIGSERTFTAARDGALFLGVNEGNLDDNSGSFEVRVEIEPA